MQPEFTRRLVDATGIFCYDCASKNTSRSDKGGNSMDTKSLIFYRVIQGIGFMTAILRLLAPVAVVIALWLLYRIARNLEKPPKLTEEVKIVRKSLSEMLRENGVQMGKRHLGAEHFQPDGAGKALRHPGRESAPGRGECTGRTEKIITRCASPPYRPRSAWGNGSCGLFRCGAL